MPVISMRVACSWCHRENHWGEPFCSNCGHRADLPRAECDCPRCLPPRRLVRARLGERRHVATAQPRRR